MVRWPSKGPDPTLACNSCLHTSCRRETLVWGDDEGKMILGVWWDNTSHCQVERFCPISIVVDYEGMGSRHCFVNRVWECTSRKAVGRMDLATRLDEKCVYMLYRGPQPSSTPLSFRSWSTQSSQYPLQEKISCCSMVCGQFFSL
jgi:hypothetical protein